MNFRIQFFRISIILAICLYLGVETFGVQEKRIKISPISMHWNPETREFDTYFSVKNLTESDAELTSIIIFRVNGYKRWRGTRLPIIKGKTERFFKISNPVGILLKNDRITIKVNIYGKDYKGYIDRSSRYLQVQSQRLIGQGKTQLEITEIKPPIDQEGLKIKKRLFQIGAEEELDDLLKTEHFQNAELKSFPPGVIPSIPEKPSMAELLPSSSISAEPGLNKITISWSPVPGATGYNLYWSNSSGVTKNNGTKIENVSSGFAHERLDKDVTFYYVVTTVKDGAESPESNEVSGIPLVLPPSPKKVRLLAGESKITLFWEEVDDAEFYNIYWSTSKEISREFYQKISGVTSGYEHEVLQNDIEHYYFVTSVNSVGESAVSELVAGIPEIKPPEAPSSITARAGKRQIIIEWSPVERVTSYNLYWSTSPEVTKVNGIKISNVSTGFVHDLLESTIPYFYVITAVRKGKESVESTEVSTVPLIPPSPPENLRLEAGDSQVTIFWDPVKDAVHYNLYWSKLKEISMEQYQKIKVEQNSFEQMDLENGVTYYYFVTAENLSGESNASRQMSSTPAIPLPGLPELKATAGDKTVSFFWKDVPVATSYNLYWSDTPDVDKTEGQKISGVKSGYEITGLQNETTYYYVLTAVNIAGESEVSPEVSAMPRIPPPAAPLLAFEVGDGKVILTWEKVPSAIGYNLYWSTQPGVNKSNGEKIAAVKSGFENTGLQNDTSYYYILTAENESGEGEISPEILAIPKIPAIVETPVSELLEAVRLDEFSAISTDKDLMVDISDAKKAREASLKRAKDLEALDISSREKLIALFIAEGKSESITEALTGQLSKEPENLNLSLSLSKVYHEQGDVSAALNVLNSSLNRISLSARIALNQELKTSIKKGETTLTKKSEEAYLADEFSKLGISLLEKKKYIEALSAFQSLYSLAQDYPMVKYYMGLSRQGMRQYNQAGQLFVEQSQQDIAKRQLLDDLSSLTSVLAVTLDIKTILSTKKRFQELLQKENTAEETAEINGNISTLDKLFAEAEQKRLAGLSDLGIAFSKTFQLKDVQPEQDIYLDFIATNFGKKDSAEFKVYYQLLHEQGMPYDLPISDRFKPIKANNEFLVWNKRISIPKNVLPGKYQLIANIEQIGGVNEVTLENNKVVSQLAISIIPPMADLKIELAKNIQPRKISVNQIIPIEFRVKNMGYKNSPEFSVQYKLRHVDGTVTELKGEDKFKSLSKAGKSFSWLKKIEIPDSLHKGKYQVIAEIKFAKEKAELNKENNQVISGLNLQFIPPFTDLAIQFEEELQKQSIQTGQTVTGNFYLWNYGNIDSAAVKVLYQLKHEDGTIYSIPDSDRLDSIKAGNEPVILEKVLRIPDKLPAGKYQLVVILQPEEKELEENRENNSISSGFSLDIIPTFSDLEIDFSEKVIPQEIQSPGEIDIELKVRNKGNRDSAGVVVRYFLRDAKGTVIPFSDQDQFNTIPAKTKAVTWKKTLKIPAEMKPGYFQLIAQLKLDDMDLEKDESNNRVESTEDLLYLPSYSDIAIKLLKDPSPSKIQAGESVDCRFQISYVGNIDSSEYKVIYQLLDAQGLVYKIFDPDSFPSLHPEQKTKTWNKTLKIPIRFKGGSYRLRAIIERPVEMVDSNPKNDRVIAESSLEIVAAFSDLELIFVSDLNEQEVQPQEKINVKLSIKNKGNRASSEIQVRYFLQHESGEMIEFPEIDRLRIVDGEGGVISWENNLTLPTVLKVGKYRIMAELRLTDKEWEINLENNKVESMPVLVYRLPLIEKVQPPAAELVEEKPSNLFMHIAALSFTLGSAWQSQIENKKYQDEQNRYIELTESYKTTRSTSEISIVQAELQNSKSQMELYAQNANSWDMAVLLGVGWEIYNIFFWTPDKVTEFAEEDIAKEKTGNWLTNDSWWHVSAISLTLASAWMSLEEQNKYNELSSENKDLQNQYRTSSSQSEVVILKKKIQSNRAEMGDHIDSANIFDGVALIALGWESYLLWQYFSDSEQEVTSYRIFKTPVVSWRPWFMGKNMGIALQWTW